MKHITSILFLTNAVHALIRGAYLYSASFAALTMTSVAVHVTEIDSAKWDTLFWVDQAAIFSVFLLGLYYVFQVHSSLQMLAVITILVVILIYYGGWLTDSCCFDSCETAAIHAHCCMHIIGSFGHHAIMFGL